MIKIILLILLSEIWGTVGQVFYKKAANKAGTPNLRDLSSIPLFIGRILLSPAIWTGLSFILVGMAIWLTALAQTDLSIAFPIDSMQYVVTLVAAHFFLNEKVNKLKLIGTLLVVGGIILVAMS